MSSAGRISNILLGIGMCVLIWFIIAVMLLYSDRIAVLIVIFVLGCSLIVNGLRSLVFYGNMARHMVGGRMTLYRGLILLDLGVFIIGTFSGSENEIIMTYILAFRAVNGIIALLRMIESKKTDAPWKKSMITAVINLGLVVVGSIFTQSSVAVVLVYCIGLAVTAITRIATAFQKTAIVYIA